MSVLSSSIILHPYSWEIFDGNKTSIRVWCKDRYSQTHLVRYEDYSPFAIVELPVYIYGRKHLWDEKAAFDIFNAIAGLRGAGDPISYEFFMGERLYGFQVYPSPFLKLYFPNLKSMNKCKYRIDKGIKYENTLVRLKLHETKISLKNKLVTERNVSLAFWQRITGFHPAPVDIKNKEKDGFKKDIMGNLDHSSPNRFVQISKLPIEREWIGDYRMLEPVNESEIENWQFYYSELGVDAEQYSNNHRIFPDQWNINHMAFMLSCNFQVQLQPETRQRYCIVLGSVNHIPPEKLANAFIIEVAEEVEILEQLHQIVEKHDPDVFLGYNLDYDYPMLDARLQLYDSQWPNISRLRNYDVSLQRTSWQSSGYGFNEINRLDMPGRFTVDMYSVVRRTKKLLKYNLDFVASQILSKNKHDVSPQEMFLTFERNQAALKRYLKAADSSSELLEDPVEANQFIQHRDQRLRQADKAIEAWINELENSTPKQIEEYRRDQFDDVNNPVDSPIFDRMGKLNWCSKTLWQGIAEKASIVIEEMPSHFKEVNPFVLGELAAAKYVMTRVAIYCCIDADLCLDLADKLNTLINVTQMADAANVTVEEVNTRGQQVRADHLLYRYAVNNAYCRIPKCDSINSSETCQDDTCLRTKCHYSKCKNEHCRIDRCAQKEKCQDNACRLKKCHNSKCPCPHIFLPSEERSTKDYRSAISRYRTVLDTRESENTHYKGAFVFDVIAGVYDKALTVDFSSLYPSIMRQYNTCYTTLVDVQDYKNIDDKYCFVIQVPISQEKKEEEEDSDDESEEEYEPEYVQRKNKEKASSNLLIQDGKYIIKFVRPEVKRGIVPHVLAELIRRRKEVRAEQKFLPPDSIGWQNREGQQQALKTTANSIYGFTGAAKKGRRPLFQISSSVTALGQELIKAVNKYAEGLGYVAIYGDTDSSMLVNPDIPNDQLVKKGKEVAKLISENFGDHLNLEFEKALRAIFIKKKHYVGYKYEEDGSYELNKKTGEPLLFIRGIPLARRDNAKWLLETYERIVHIILNDNPLSVCIEYLVKRIRSLLDGDVNTSDLILVRGIGAAYKDETYFMKMFADRLAADGRPVKPGERVGYLVKVPSTPEEGQYLGNRMVLPDEYERSLFTDNPIKLNYLYYLTNQFSNKLDVLLSAGYSRVINYYTEICCRPTTRHRDVNISLPMKMICKMIPHFENTIERDIFLDKIVTSVQAVEKGQYDQIPLCKKYEHNGYNIAPAQSIPFNNIVPVAISMPSSFVLDNEEYVIG